MTVPIYPVLPWSDLPKSAEDLSHIVNGADIAFCGVSGNVPYDEEHLGALLSKRDYVVDHDEGPDGSRHLENHLARLNARISGHPLLTSGKVVSNVSRREMTEVIDFQPENQIITVQSGKTFGELEEFLNAHGQCIPFGQDGAFELGDKVPLHYLVEYNCPHSLLYQNGTWRDWITSMKIVLPSGEVVSCGSKVVKSVSGFDLHKMMIGARGSLGVITEITIRTTSVQSKRTPDVEIRSSDDPYSGSGPRYHRVKRSNWQELTTFIRDHSTDFTLDHAACQADYTLPENVRAPSFEGDIFVTNIRDELRGIEQGMQRLMKRTKGIFDPTNKLNPGVFGFL